MGYYPKPAHRHGYSTTFITAILRMVFFIRIFLSRAHIAHFLYKPQIPPPSTPTHTHHTTHSRNSPNAQEQKSTLKKATSWTRNACHKSTSLPYLLKPDWERKNEWFNDDECRLSSATSQETCRVPSGAGDIHPRPWPSAILPICRVHPQCPRDGEGRLLFSF